MLDQARSRTAEFQSRLKDAGIDLALITDESSIAYLAGFWGYLSVEFGRPTFLLVRPDASPLVITPLMESEMVGAMTWIDDIATWEDAGDNRWENVLANAIGDHPGQIGVERAAGPDEVLPPSRVRVLRLAVRVRGRGEPGVQQDRVVALG